MRYRELLTAIAASVVTALAVVPAVSARPGPVPQPTNAADSLRTGWYADQPGLAPATVSSPQFGRLFTAPVTGQVYAQPLVFRDTLLVATEDNYVYGLDPATGAERWAPRQVGTPFDPSEVGCGDLTPNVGITGTPTIDPASGRAYFTAKSYEPVTRRVRYDMHAIDVATGVEADGFPVELRGQADNNSQIPFNARYQLQRPGLLLLDGVVYAGFAGHCDRNPWKGWIFGVRADTGAVTARWIANSDGVDGAGIWQSGGGLVSDGPGRILVTTGNGSAPHEPRPGRTPPSGLGESLVRIDVQPDGKLQAVDFFAPYDAEQLDTWDADFGSTAPTILPRPWFGDRSLAVAGGKAGNFYLFDADDLGGMMQSPTGGDKVLQQLSSLGGTWSRFAVWPGDGGWIYYPTASDGTSASGSEGKLQALEFGTDSGGRPLFSVSGRSEDGFGFGSGAPVVTSDGDTSGSALLWIVHTFDGGGGGAQLRAYDPVPVRQQLQLRRSFPIGTATKFAPPGIAGGRVFVGTREGTVLGFGVPANAPLVGSGASFPTTVVGNTSGQITVTLRATRAVTVQSFRASGPFDATLGGLPRTLAADDEITIPVTFRPTTWGPAGGTLSLATSEGPVDVGLSGTGEAAAGFVVANTRVVRFDGVVPGSRSTDSVTLTNVGATPVTLTAERSPTSPFALVGSLPPSLARGAKVTISFTFSPTTTGIYGSELSIRQSGGANLVIGLTGASVTPAHLQIDPQALDFGSVVTGTSAIRSFRLTNTGGAALTLTKSKPPALGPFAAATPGAAEGNPIPEGTVLAGGAQVDVSVRFTPSGLGATADGWILNATDDGGGVREVSFRGVGAAADVPVQPGGGGGGNLPPQTPVIPITPVIRAPVTPKPPVAGFVGPAFSARSLRLRGAGVVKLRVSCPRSATQRCSGTLLLRGRGSARGARTRTLGSARFALAPGRSQLVAVTLTRDARGQLARGTTLRGDAELRVLDGRRAAHTTRVALTLLPPRR